MILKPKVTEEQTYRRGAALALEHRHQLQEMVEALGMQAVAELARVTQQTVGKGVLGEPLYKCSRRRLQDILASNTA